MDMMYVSISFLQHQLQLRSELLYLVHDLFLPRQFCYHNYFL